MSAQTIPHQFLHSVETFDQKTAFRRKIGGHYENVTYREAYVMVHNAAAGLRSLNLAKKDRVAILSENRLEWAIADLATLSAGCITVPIYPSLPANQVEYILRDAEARAVFVSTEAQLQKVFEIEPGLPTLQHTICFDSDGNDDRVMSMAGLITRGEIVENKPDYREMISTIGKYDWASIIYTSGTTGRPKGAILTHNNFMSNVRSCLAVLELGPDDTCLSFLPLSHVFERTAGYYVMLTAGTTIAYAESMDTVAENLAEVSPTIVCGVPRFYEKTYSKILEKVESGSGMKRHLFQWALKTGKKFVSENFDDGPGFLTKRKHGIASALVFKKLRARVGGRLRFFVSGGAPLAREINEFFHAAGIPILEGYGLTETSPVLAVNTFDNFKFGTVGKPLPGVEIKIAEDGEILAKGDNVMLGYFKKPEETNEALEGGWFHTGDIGHIDDDGFLTITDRKKDVIVTAGGKNIAPQTVENCLKASRYIDEVVLLGNRRKFVSALIVPNFENLEQVALSMLVPHTSKTELVASPQVVEFYSVEIERLSESLASFEKVKKFALIDHEFAIESGELTPSLKIKRKVVEDKYKSLIDVLYES